MDARMKREIWLALNSASTMTGMIICLIWKTKLSQSLTTCVVS